MGTINYRSNNDFLTFGYNFKGIEEDCYFQTKDTIGKYNYLRVSVEGGYYEGFYIEIEIDVNFFYDDYEKEIALKEVERLEKELEICIYDYHVVVCYPGWGTSYENKERSLKLLHEEIQNLKQKINEIEVLK